MTWFADLRKRWGRREPPPIIPVTIDGQEYVVTESARAQAASNMRHDRAKRDAVEQLLIRQYGKEAGRATMRARYPESFYDD